MKRIGMILFLAAMSVGMMTQVMAQERARVMAQERAALGDGMGFAECVFLGTGTGSEQL